MWPVPQPQGPDRLPARPRLDPVPGHDPDVEPMLHPEPGKARLRDLPRSPQERGDSSRALRVEVPRLPQPDSRNSLSRRFQARLRRLPYAEFVRTGPEHTVLVYRSPHPGSSKSCRIAQQMIGARPADQFGAPFVALDL